LASIIVIHQRHQIPPSSETQTQTDAMQVSSREPPPPRTPPRTPEEGAELEAEQESLPDSEQEQVAQEVEEEPPEKFVDGASGCCWNHGIGLHSLHYSTRKSMLKFCALRMKEWRNPAW
jgi:hypothetical protein